MRPLPPRHPITGRLGTRRLSNTHFQIQIQKLSVLRARVDSRRDRCVALVRQWHMIYDLDSLWLQRTTPHCNRTSYDVVTRSQRLSAQTCKSVLPRKLQFPRKLRRKKWKTCAGNYYKRVVIQETCTKIVAMFYSASLIRNDHGEQELFVLTEFGYKHLQPQFSLPVKR